VSVLDDLMQETEDSIDAVGFSGAGRTYDGHSQGVFGSLFDSCEAGGEIRSLPRDVCPESGVHGISRCVTSPDDFGNGMDEMEMLRERDEDRRNCVEGVATNFCWEKPLLVLIRNFPFEQFPDLVVGENGRQRLDERVSIVLGQPACAIRCLWKLDCFHPLIFWRSFNCAASTSSSSPVIGTMLV
jgi:hypothetical protein